MTVAEMFKTEPLDATFGAVITDINLVKLDETAFAKLYETWLEYALLIFPGQYMTNDEQTAFALRFGDLEFDLAPISNVRKDGSVRDGDDDVVKILQGNMGWHMDSTYMPVQAKGAVFSAHTVTRTKGETGWADMSAAYEQLDIKMKTRIADLSAYHSLYYSQSKMGHKPGEGSDYSGYGFFNQDPPLRPLVKMHPETNRPALTIGRHAYGIPGMDADESEQLLQDLVDQACQAPRIYHHSWKTGDVVLWDNRCLLHQARPWDMSEPRIMYHARIAGDPVTEFAAP